MTGLRPDAAASAPTSPPRQGSFRPDAAGNAAAAPPRQGSFRPDAARSAAPAPPRLATIPSIAAVGRAAPHREATIPSMGAVGRAAPHRQATIPSIIAVGRAAPHRQPSLSPDNTPRQGSSRRPHGESVAAPTQSQDSDDNDPDPDHDEEEQSFDSLFETFSEQWLQAQLTHHVSLAASNDFWKLSFKYVSEIIEMKRQENINKKIPQFLQIRKNIYKSICPDIKMNFAYLNNTDNSIIHVDVDHTPVKEFERNPQYQKLYEEAHIQVISSMFNELHNFLSSKFVKGQVGVRAYIFHYIWYAVNKYFITDDYDYYYYYYDDDDDDDYDTFLLYFCSHRSKI